MESTQTIWTDTHCHLYSNEFDGERNEMVERAIAGGIKAMYMPNVDLDSVQGMESLRNSYPDHCFPMMGLHPCSVTPDFQNVLNEMRVLFNEGKYYGVGETGIDLYWDTTFRKQQEESFKQQIDWALQLDLPIIIHSRESQDLTIDIISHFQNGNLRGIFHCFGGTIEQAKKIQDLGFMMGIGGVVTFKKSDLRDVIKYVSVDNLVLETDSPYLAPVPYRGKRNEPLYLKLVAKEVAISLSMDLTELASITNENAERVFQKKH